MHRITKTSSLFFSDPASEANADFARYLAFAYEHYFHKTGGYYVISDIYFYQQQGNLQLISLVPIHLESDKAAAHIAKLISQMQLTGLFTDYNITPIQVLLKTSHLPGKGIAVTYRVNIVVTPEFDIPNFFEKIQGYIMGYRLENIKNRNVVDDDYVQQLRRFAEAKGMPSATIEPVTFKAIMALPNGMKPGMSP